MPKPWLVTNRHGGDLAECHVVPLGDPIGHERPGDDCPCGPLVEFQPAGRVVVHYALDGRESAYVPPTG